MQFLIEQKADVNAKNSQGLTALMVSSMTGFTDGCRHLLEAKADPNVAEPQDRDTALSLAVFKNFTPTALLLIANGADCNCIDSKGEVPLHDACANGNAKIAVALIPKTRDINMKCGEGSTPLHNACSNATAMNEAAECARALIDAKADVLATNKDSKTALQVSALYTCSKLLVDKVAKSPADRRQAFLNDFNIDHVRKFLTEFPNDVEVATADKGDTLLILAARNNKLEVVKLLVDEYRASVNNPNVDHSSPLMASSMRGYDEIVKFLIAHGANINQRTKNLDSPLSLAVWKDHYTTARLLIDAGANVTGIDRFGDSMLHDASKNGNATLVKYFLSKAMNLDHRNNEGFTPLHRAAEFGHAPVIKLLLEGGADFTIEDNKGHTPLDIAKDEKTGEPLKAAKAAKAEKERKQAQLVESAASAAPTAGGAVGGGGGADMSVLVPLLTSLILEVSKLRQAVEKIAEHQQHRPQ
jgi:ankyrin